MSVIEKPSAPVTSVTTDMGNVNPNAKTPASPTGNKVLTSSNKQTLQRNALNAKEAVYKVPPTYIHSAVDMVTQSTPKKSPTDQEKGLTVTQAHDDARRSSSPMPNGTFTSLTKDVNNSRSSTPVFGRKSPVSHHRDQSASSDQHRSSSNGSLKDSQAKDIMISYSHLDKDIMLKLKGAYEVATSRPSRSAAKMSASQLMFSIQPVTFETEFN